MHFQCNYDRINVFHPPPPPPAAGGLGVGGGGAGGARTSWGTGGGINSSGGIIGEAGLLVHHKSDFWEIPGPGPGPDGERGLRRRRREAPREVRRVRLRAAYSAAQGVSDRQVSPF